MKLETNFFPKEIGTSKMRQYSIKKLLLEEKYAHKREESLKLISSIYKLG